MFKGRYKVYSTNDLFRVKETERIVVYKSNAMKSMCLPSCPVSHVPAKPSHPQKLYPLWVGELGCRSDVSNIGMEDTDDAGIPIWVTIPFVFVDLAGQNHNVGMCARVHGVLSTSHIICSIVDSKNFVLVYTIVDKRDATSFFICKIVVFSIESLIKNPRKNMVFETGKKILV
jgi:hypothetical protein